MFEIGLWTAFPAELFTLEKCGGTRPAVRRGATNVARSAIWRHSC